MQIVLERVGTKLTGTLLEWSTQWPIGNPNGEGGNGKRTHEVWKEWREEVQNLTGQGFRAAINKPYASRATPQGPELAYLHVCHREDE